ncbi:substrate-binding domain-containing protein [Bradyrhizobium sp. 14AA]
MNDQPTADIQAGFLEEESTVSLPPKRGVFRVAEMAGVSIATVSRTFNDPQRVRKDVRKRVMEAATAAGYVPNSAAKALRLQRTRVIGAVIPTLDHAIYAKLVNGMQAQLADDGYTVIVLSVGFDNSHIFEAVRRIVERGAEALMVVGRVVDEKLRHFLETKQIPFVQTYSFVPESGELSVGIDNFTATRDIVNHLLDLGHTNLTMIAGPTAGNDRQISRRKAFQDTLRERGLAASRPIIEKTYRFESGIQALQEIRELFPETTGIVCSSDILAFGVLHACHMARIDVPGDISVTGFDDLDFAQYLSPPLTTVAIRSEEMGRIAAERLVAILDGNTAQSECLATQLVVRSSTARPIIR